jgi:hypothetical protein
MRALVLATVLGVSGFSAGAMAQPAVHKEGEYTGVSPGKPPPESAPASAPRRAVGKGALSWVGFAAKDGGAEVFFQSATKFEVIQEVEGTTLVVKLAGLTRQVTNTRRPIDTRFFDNPLARITAQPGKRSSKRSKSKARGIDVRIVFKNPKEAAAGTLRMATEADGLFYAYLSFPEGADSAVIPSSGLGNAQLSAPPVREDLGDSLDEPASTGADRADSAPREDGIGGESGGGIGEETDDEVPDAKAKTAKAKAKTTRAKAKISK